MDQMLSAIAQWVDTSFGTIFCLCFVIYSIAVFRFIAYTLSVYKNRSISDWSMEISVPKDVSVSVELQTLVACASIVIVGLYRDPTLATGIVVVIIDIIVAFCAIGLFWFPQQYYKNSSRQHKNQPSKMLRGKSTKNDRVPRA